MSQETPTVRFRLAGWVGELLTADRRLTRDVRTLFYEPATPEEPVNGSYRAFVDRRFGAEKRHWLRDANPGQALRITPFYPSLLEALAWSATRAAAAFQGPGRYPLVGGAVSGPAGALIVFGDGDGLRPRTIQALTRSGLSYCGDGLAVVEPARRRLVPYARALAMPRPAHGLTTHGRGERPFRNRERETHRYVLPDLRHPTGDGVTCPVGALLFLRAAEAPGVRAMPQGEALLGMMEHRLGDAGDAFGDLAALVAEVPAFEVGVRGAKRTIDRLRAELPDLLPGAAGDASDEAIG